MSETLIRTLDVCRKISKSATIKGHRGFSDFLADRIAQAATQPDLLSFVEKLITLLQSETVYNVKNEFRPFLEILKNNDAYNVLSWVREFPKVTAMIATQKSDTDFISCVEAIEIDGDSLAIDDVACALPAYDVGIKIGCLSPLAHGGDQKAGNATLFRRMQIMSTSGRIMTLPFYAGNAFRGQMRDALADHFLMSLGLTPNRTNPPCSLWFFHALYAGGALEENSVQAKTIGDKLGKNGAISGSGIHEFRNMIPPLSVLGSALGNRIISGRANFGDFRPVCKQWGFDTNIDVNNLFEWLFLTRREDHESHESGKNCSMIANTECLKIGTQLKGGIDLSMHCTDIESACIAKGLMLMTQKQYIGSDNRRGFGNFDMEINCGINTIAYDDFLKTEKENILKYLFDIKGINGSYEHPDASDDSLF